MRGKRAKLAAFAAKYSHKNWRMRLNLLKYGVNKVGVNKDQNMIISSEERQRYQKFKTFIKRRRSAPHAKSMGNGYIIKKLWGDKVYKRWAKKWRKTDDMATKAGSVVKAALQKITGTPDATAS